MRRWSNSPRTVNGLGGKQARTGRNHPAELDEGSAEFPEREPQRLGRRVGVSGCRLTPGATLTTRSSHPHCHGRQSVSDQGRRNLALAMIAWLRYGDIFVKVDGAWPFAERSLYVDWSETRPSLP
jgi:hypothetical protein